MENKNKKIPIEQKKSVDQIFPVNLNTLLSQLNHLSPQLRGFSSALNMHEPEKIDEKGKVFNLVISIGVKLNGFENLAEKEIIKKNKVKKELKKKKVSVIKKTDKKLVSKVTKKK